MISSVVLKYVFNSILARICHQSIHFSSVSHISLQSMHITNW